MRSMILNTPGGLDKLELTEAPDPTPGPLEVLVQWHASSLNYHDYLVVKGVIKTEDQRIPMSDGAGVVLAVGEHVTRWKPGDKVISTFFPNWVQGVATPALTSAVPGDSIHGTAVEQACVAETALTAMPDDYSFTEAATLPCAALTAWRALMVEGNLKAGDTVLVEGSGGMSIFGLQLAKAAGAYVYATTSAADKAARLKDLGADFVINYKDDPNWGETIYKHASGGVDHVLDVGGNPTLKQSVAAAKCGAVVSLIGVLGGISATIILPVLFAKQLRLQGISVGSREMQQNMIKAININKIKPVIDRSFPLEELANAFRYQETNQHFGKIVVEY